MLTALDKLQHELWLHELRKKDPKTYFSQEMVWDTVEAIRSIARDRKLTISMTGFEGAETTFYADGEVTILRSNSERTNQWTWSLNQALRRLACANETKSF